MMRGPMRRLIVDVVAACRGPAGTVVVALRATVKRVAPRLARARGLNEVAVAGVEVLMEAGAAALDPEAEHTLVRRVLSAALIAAAGALAGAAMAAAAASLPPLLEAVAVAVAAATASALAGALLEAVWPRARPLGAATI